MLARARPLLEVEARVREQAQRVMADGGGPIVDERLRLVLLCAHPDLSRESAAALSLRLVLGVPTTDLARLFLVPTPTMAARLTRAKRRLAGASFALPSGPSLEDRLELAAEVAYLAFTAGYAPGSGADVVRAAEAGEAIRLVRLLRDLAPRPDLDALLALMLLQHSRRDARVAGGRLVLLPDQDRGRWHHDEIGEALELLTPLMRTPSSAYLLQALIAAEHAVAPSASATDWPRIVRWYDELERLTGSPVVRLNRAIAVGEADGPHAGLRLLEDVDLPGHRLPTARAELAVRAGLVGLARASYDEAIAACDNDAERDHLQRRRAALE